MYDRCKFLDEFPGFNYNTGGGEYVTDESGVERITDTRQLGSTILHRMLGEVHEFCKSSKDWNIIEHHQVK